MSPWPRRYADLQHAEGHPVDEIVDALPDVQRLARKLAALAKRVESACLDRHLFDRLQDLRVAQAERREALFFDAGHAMGEALGRAAAWEASAAFSEESRALARSVIGLVETVGLARTTVAAVLIELARSYALAGRPEQPTPD